MAPSEEINAAVFAEEDFVVDVQIYLHQLMEEKGVSRSELARAMGVSRARITQIFSDDCKNFTVRLLARAAHALGEEPKVISKRATEGSGKEEKSSETVQLLMPEDVIRVWEMRDMFDDARVQ